AAEVTRLKSLRRRLIGEIRALLPRLLRGREDLRLFFSSSWVKPPCQQRLLHPHFQILQSTFPAEKFLQRHALHVQCISRKHPPPKIPKRTRIFFPSCSQNPQPLIKIERTFSGYIITVTLRLPSRQSVRSAPAQKIRDKIVGHL